MEGLLTSIQHDEFLHVACYVSVDYYVIIESKHCREQNFPWSKVNVAYR